MPGRIRCNDVHWADAASLRWLARSLDELTGGVLCAVRSWPGSR
ncbi:MAG: hypothetical protein WBP81_09670 [Solirubrobacteraceae bacterium]